MKIVKSPNKSRKHHQRFIITILLKNRHTHTLSIMQEETVAIKANSSDWRLVVK